ncbi:GntR family transcriptional regulator (plasmid) [Peteryoungia desertarenae]|uniref:GntR family transcriptional regulator n=1 Tax=Peteryoungia desertarenae TaxID=1813451 RepID=A0ABX6QUG1_9HYPH|nr:GntR family transcriptional regulator [Peteryoungia desertarenae]QLF72042.1 GntR family transcriptional regulator [Peteryoungia desertarenae]
MNKPDKRVVTRAGTTVEQMVRAIADLIVTGALRPGEKLDEVSLAGRFDVSRTPVREALRQLCAMGLVDRQPNKRAVVTNVSGKHLHAMFEAMAELEAVCARLAAQRMTSVERKELRDMHQASKRFVDASGGEDYAAYNTEFHTQIYRGAHNDYIFELVTATRARLSPFRHAQFRLEGRLSQSWREHDRIVEAIISGQADEAAKAAYDHVSIVSEASASFALPR